MIELLITIAVVGILAMVIIPNVSGFIKDSHVAAANAELAAVQSAAQAYYADNTDSSADFTSDTLYTAGILSAATKYGFYTFNPHAELYTSGSNKPTTTSPNVKWGADSWIRN